MTTTQLNFEKDVQGFNTFAPSPSTNKFSAALASAGNSTVTVPSNYENWVVSFSFEPGSTIWVAYNTSAAAPAGGTFASNVSELNPGSRAVTAGTTINCYNNGTDTADIGIIMYGIP